MAVLSKIVPGLWFRNQNVRHCNLAFSFLGVNFGTPESEKPENPSPKAESVDAYIFIGHAYLFFYFCLEYL